MLCTFPLPLTEPSLGCPSLGVVYVPSAFDGALVGIALVWVLCTCSTFGLLPALFLFVRKQGRGVVLRVCHIAAAETQSGLLAVEWRVALKESMSYSTTDACFSVQLQGAATVLDRYGSAGHATAYGGQPRRNGPLRRILNRQVVEQDAGLASSYTLYLCVHPHSTI